MEQAAFADKTYPLGRLNAPGNYQEETTKSVLDSLSKVVTWINDFIRWASRKLLNHEINPVQWLTEAIGGDWSDLLSIRDVWNNLSWASQDISANLTHGLSEVNRQWDGYAAQAFEAHMGKWYLAVTENEKVCLKIRDTTSALAHFAKEFLQAAIDVVELLVSLMGGALIKAILKIRKIIDIVSAAYKLYKDGKKAVEAGVSIAQAISAGNAVNAPDLKVNVPETPYGGPQAPGSMVMNASSDLDAQFTELVEGTAEESRNVARAAREEKGRPVDEGELRDLERRVGDHFRSGAAGPVAQAVQERLDAGASWESLMSDPLVLDNLWGLFDAVYAVYEGGGPSGGDTDTRTLMRDAW